ncbi:DUF6036 family nucleotidyltransferase [Candidatus Lokiarchaeum ossiferum]|uniref:DUF6036 family nucleotidyltransferase n=1 Tax=Candidatus Lokiarchaeum ossiferum TaxID=2951803 RepID=UPI00352CD5B0
MAEIENILSRLEKIFTEIQLDYVIVGGLAAIIKGKARTTTDIDIILQNNPTKIAQFLELLKEQNFDVLDEQIQLAFQEDMNASIFDNLSVMRLDIKIAKKRIDIEALNGAIIENYNQLSLKVASVESILLGKIWFLGDISDIPDSELLEYNDIIDFLNVYVNNRDSCDIGWVKKKVSLMKLSTTLNRVLNLCKKNLI